MTAYQILERLVINYEAGKGNLDAETLRKYADAYYGAHRITQEEYFEMTERINAAEEARKAEQ